MHGGRTGSSRSIGASREECSSGRCPANGSPCRTSSLGESLIANLGTLACQRLMDAQQFDRASVQMRQLLSVPSALNDEQREPDVSRPDRLRTALRPLRRGSAALHCNTRALSGAGEHLLRPARAVCVGEARRGSARKSQLRANSTGGRGGASSRRAASSALMTVVDAPRRRARLAPATQRGESYSCTFIRRFDGRAFEWAKFEPTLWDHEHCAMCGQSSPPRRATMYGWRTDGGDWVCAAWHAEYQSEYRWTKENPQ